MKFTAAYWKPKAPSGKKVNALAVMPNPKNPGLPIHRVWIGKRFTPLVPPPLTAKKKQTKQLPAAQINPFLLNPFPIYLSQSHEKIYIISDLRLSFVPVKPDAFRHLL
jgi:hypothetical protein